MIGCTSKAKYLTGIVHIQVMMSIARQAKIILVQGRLFVHHRNGNIVEKGTQSM
jgi:hypothetical protein